MPNRFLCNTVHEGKVLMTPKCIVHVVGARPNFMKAAPVFRALAELGFEQRLIHTGQHFDSNMSGVFFSQLGLKRPDVNLEVGSGSHSYQVAHVMLKIEPYFIRWKPAWVIVYGDVNSTVAATMVGVKLGLRVCHVEAGLRSRDRAMPEEHNRIVTDHLADLLLAPSKDGVVNLIAEGIPRERIRLIGNVMIDSLCAASKDIPLVEKIVPQLENNRRYALLTLHRPSNVDNAKALAKLFRILGVVSLRLPIVFPLHPRTRKMLPSRLPPGFILTDPLGYKEFLALQKGATVVLTDSGGIQEETTYFGVPCITIRSNTERPITVQIGTNVLVGDNPGLIPGLVAKAVLGKWKTSRRPPLWDGKASQRAARFIAESSCRK